MMPSMDPIQWKEETERVAIRLKNLENSIKMNGDWNSHLLILKDYIKNNNNNNSIRNKSISNKDKKDNNLFSDLLANGDKESIIDNLDVLRSNLSQHLISLNRLENILNSREKINILSAEFSENKKVWNYYFIFLYLFIQIFIILFFCLYIYLFIYLFSHPFMY